jgi:glyoxylase-like metal-dependent hydrolase (beta-lactamase superfamily II)
MLLEGGEEIPLGPLRLRVEWTPAHTPGHVILHEDARRLVFLGDHILPTASPNIGIDQDVPGNPLPGYLESLRGFIEGPDLLALPGHGHVFDLVARARQLLEHQEERGRRVLRAVAAGARTAHEVRPFAWDDETWAALSPGLRVNAIRTLAAHLERLGQLGLLTREPSTDLDAWRATEGASSDDVAGPGESEADEHD